MPQIDIDGANSKISADTIQGHSGTTVTVTSGHNLAGSGSGLTALNATNLGSGTVPDARLGGDKTCKVWVNFNGTGTVAIRDSFNVSSITDVDVGQYQVNISSALANANYSILLGGSGDGIQTTRESSMGVSTSGGAISTTSFRIFSTTVGESDYSDFEFANALVFGG